VDEQVNTTPAARAVFLSAEVCFPPFLGGVILLFFPVSRLVVFALVLKLLPLSELKPRSSPLGSSFIISLVFRNRLARHSPFDTDVVIAFALPPIPVLRFGDADVPSHFLPPPVGIKAPARLGDIRSLNCLFSFFSGYSGEG